MMIVVAGNVDAQTHKTKKKMSGTKYKTTTHKTTIKRTIKPTANTGTLKATVPSGALPMPTRERVIIDETTSDDHIYNPYRKFTPAESAPEDPAPGFENVNMERNRLPNTDKLSEPH